MKQLGSNPTGAIAGQPWPDALPAKRTIAAIVVEPKIKDEEWEYLLDMSRGPIDLPPHRGTLAVRLYPNPKEDPTSFTLKYVDVDKERRITELDAANRPVKKLLRLTMPDGFLSDVGTSAVAWADPLDQKDPQVSPYIEAVTSWLPGIPGSKRPWFRAVEQRVLYIKTADGQPLANASVVVKFAGRLDRSSFINATERFADHEGMLLVDGYKQDAYIMSAMRISHPDYGCVLLQSGWGGQEEIALPLIAADNPLLASGLEAAVVDPEGRPIMDAEVKTASLVLARGRRINLNMSQGSIRTNEKGYFRLFPTEKLLKGRLKMSEIPLGAKYLLRVKAPPELGLLEYIGEFANNEPMRIVLERGAHFHTFAFNSASGPITDAKVLEKIRVEIRRRPANIFLSEPEWENGAIFILRATLGQFRILPTMRAVRAFS